jgi:hypothetical protein
VPRDTGAGGTAYQIEGPGRYKTMTLKPGEFILRFLPDRRTGRSYSKLPR